LRWVIVTLLMKATFIMFIHIVFPVKEWKHYQLHF